MSRTVVTTSNAPTPPAGVPLSQAVCKGNLVQVSGQTGVDPTTGRPVSDSVAEQTEQALRNVFAILEEAGAGVEDVLMLRVYLTDVTHFAEMNQTYARVVGDPYPARTTVYVGLPPHLLVEIDALAVRG
ncbi:reactive intermediate/imine deaminase [Actinopolyspora erythraea]|uniref:Endoribonuclease L-PSP n=1 Tax=Actinopolyspora erythraea TaxID=414996 RepID=A0A099D809_9ACTN|nr:Rid family detoxifying hydrolase [Actinopolyspora erythraea]ASU78535.1 reactive intermediate/imine deaminase [Actinopolyspora erythraea]KGI82031.1 endoribonuclease L-PSP [Actinopolyspora erythraea]